MTNTEDAIKKLVWLAEIAKERQEAAGDNASVTLAGLRTRRLFGRRGPVGEIVCESQDNTFVVRFSAKAVIRACEKAIAELS